MNEFFLAKNNFKRIKSLLIKSLFLFSKISRFIRYKYYWIHYKLRKSNRKLYLQNKKIFQQKNYLLVEDFLKPNQLQVLKNILSNGDYYNLKDIRDKASNELIDLMKNKVYWYNYPSSILNDYKYLKNKNKIIEAGILEFVENYASSISKVSMRAETIECYITKNKKKEIWNSKWHTDGDHKSSMRCLIYLTTVNSSTRGELQLRTDESDFIGFASAGSCIFFKNAIVLHRGINTLKDRLCLNIKLCPGSREIKEDSFEDNINFQGNLFW